MKTKDIQTTDTYIVFNKTIIHDDDKKLITMLYQPIIGTIASALYNTLILELDKNQILSTTTTHQHLMILMQLSLDDIKTARKKLEAIGLLKTYYKEANINEYVYELYSPMKVIEFFQNPTLSMALYNSVGKNEYKILKSYFELPKISLNEYKHISVSFNEVFMSMPSKNSYDNFLTNLKDEKSLKLKFNTKFDLELIKTGLATDMINDYTFTDEIVQLILNLSFIYNIDIVKMKEIIEISLTNKKLIDKVKLRKFSRDYYQIENYGALPSLIHKSQPQSLRSNSKALDDRSKIIHQFETLTPYNFLKAKNKSKPPARELKILETLIVDINLNPGVVNVLIDYALKINNNKLNKNFIEAIATEWKRNNINTVEEAMIHVEEHSSKKNKKTYQPKQKSNTNLKPSWFNEEQKLETITKDEEEALEKLLEGYK